jgi:hypothetical protein
MVVRTCAPVSRVDIDRLYADDMTPESWLELEVRVIELLEDEVVSESQSRALVYALRALAGRGEPVPADPGDLYMRMRPILEKLSEPCA